MDAKKVAFSGPGAVRTTASRSSRQEAFLTEDGISLEPYLLQGAEVLETFPPETAEDKATTGLGFWTEDGKTYVCAFTGEGWVKFDIPEGGGVDINSLGVNVDTFYPLVVQ